MHELTSLDELFEHFKKYITHEESYMVFKKSGLLKDQGEKNEDGAHQGSTMKPPSEGWVYPPPPFLITNLYPQTNQ